MPKTGKIAATSTPRAGRVLPGREFKALVDEVARVASRSLARADNLC